MNHKQLRKERNSMTNPRQFLINQLEATTSIEDFSTAESMLVKYNTGVLTAVALPNGDPLFLLNDKVTSAQIDRAEEINDAIRNAPNDIWNAYVYGGTR
jgi:hypothetical protein